jgi:hypothetical protein
VTRKAGPPFWGKYRGTVLSNLDPEQRGRLQLVVSDVTSLLPTTWAECSAPFSGMPGAASGFFVVPAIGAAVWVEFEYGDPNKPIWTGGRFDKATDVPPLAIAPPAVPPGQNIAIQSTLQNLMLVSDSVPTPISGGIVLKSTTGAMVVVNDSGIYLNNGKGASITLIGPTVTVNNGALMVI